VLTSAIGECEHTKEEERALTGRWELDVVRLTLENGYRICEIYELYEYQVTKFNLDRARGEYSWII